MKRRDFLSGLAVTSAALAAGQTTKSTDASQNKDAQQNLKVPRITPGKNIMISAANGITPRGNHLEAGYKKLIAGADTLEAAITTVSGPENDPEDDSVGMGGLPNEDCVVELDACCMHGPSRRAGSVGAVRDIKNVAALARTVMEHTGHVMLVGQGATRFGELMGFQKENLLTEHSRKIWQLWKEYHSDLDWWGPGFADPNFKIPPNLDTGSLREQPQIKRLYELAANIGIEEDRRLDAIGKVLDPPTGTINCSALNEKGEMSSVTTTSGLAWKLAGRCGDSPIIGAGCYCDQEVGAAGATGNGEENIKICGAHTIVENMRHGMSPEEAGMDALKRIAHNYNNDMSKLIYLGMHFYILRKDGAYAGVSMWSGSAEHPVRFAVADGNGVARHETAKAMFQGSPKNWPPMPKERR
ncbi:MAG TPA: N(4)-(beta-N-acetylglucosaminyl)-L-asparaginase [Candidatus Angelobacter sp.]|jgi:N4-(beta-N-acetylglucosaminyl)-L-asparaginase|nr:N(4)-(beta-N-acetylglucosaminyl)-L-asparaginase [Candidatus Angelobacter sp.]